MVDLIARMVDNGWLEVADDQYPVDAISALLAQAGLSFLLFAF